MGIYNRDYVRNEEGFDGYGESRRPRSDMSIVMKIVIATAGVFILQLMTARPGYNSLVLDWLSMDSESIFRQGQIWRILTYAFCHSQKELLHIIFNMYVLYMLGTWVVRLTGEREFLWFYLASSVFAGLCSLVFYSFVGQQTRMIGASGAVMAVFMLFVMHFPRQRMMIMGIIPIEARWLLALYVIYDASPVVMELAGKNPQTQVAHSAHLGGLLFGFLYFRWHMRLTGWWDGFAGRMADKRRANKNLRVFNPGTQPENDVSGKVDEILKKISEQGEASLTTKERNILAQASRQLRKDRP